MTTLTAPARDHPTAAAPPGRTGASLATSSLEVARRTVRKFLRTPQLVVVGTIQGAMFLLIFRYVFGGAITTGAATTGTARYVDFLVPGFVATGVLFGGMGAAAGMAEDLDQGFLDRLRSLPIPRLSVLTGRALAETALLALNLVVTTAIGFAVGFRLDGSAAAGLAALGLCVLFGFACTWLFLTLGLVAGNAQAAQGMALLVFPLTFVSSAYVPVASMPGWMRPIAEHQPVTALVDTVRSLTLGHGAGDHLTAALVWCAGLVVAFAPLAVARFRRS